MTNVSDFQNGVIDALDFGQQIRIKYYNVGYGAGSYYDDDVTLTQSGTNYWTSGIILPITSKFGSSEATLVQQGKLLTDDKKLYIQGEIDVSGTIKIGLGSYTNMSGCEFSLLGEGVTRWDINDTAILKKLYIRSLTNGSLMGE